MIPWKTVIACQSFDKLSKKEFTYVYILGVFTSKRDEKNNKIDKTTKMKNVIECPSGLNHVTCSNSFEYLLFHYIRRSQSVCAIK